DPAMMSRRRVLGLLAASVTPVLAARRAAAAAEPPILKMALASGQIPEMTQRLPKVPRVIELAALDRKPGRYGGAVRMIITGQKDIRLMTLNGYTRLVGYDTELNLVADVLESFEVEEERIFTFRLREGHRWSDGVPVSTEDFRHAWEDVLNDPDLRPGGLPADLLAAGHGPTFEILDPLTLRYS
ncbi:ABC transporter substrate-binding protein, partial [Thioclava sp. BHET1]